MESSVDVTSLGYVLNTYPTSSINPQRANLIASSINNNLAHMIPQGYGRTTTHLLDAMGYLLLGSRQIYYLTTDTKMTASSFRALCVTFGIVFTYEDNTVLIQPSKSKIHFRKHLGIGEMLLVDDSISRIIYDMSTEASTTNSTGDPKYMIDDVGNLVPVIGTYQIKTITGTTGNAPIGDWITFSDDSVTYPSGNIKPFIFSPVIDEQKIKDDYLSDIFGNGFKLILEETSPHFLFTIQEDHQIAFMNLDKGYRVKNIVLTNSYLGTIEITIINKNKQEIVKTGNMNYPMLYNLEHMEARVIKDTTGRYLQLKAFKLNQYNGAIKKSIAVTK